MMTLEFNLFVVKVDKFPRLKSPLKFRLLCSNSLLDIVVYI